MPCTTLLVGKNATYDGSTMIARNDDAGGNDHFTPKKMIVVQPKEQPRVYKAVLSSVEIPLPENPLRYTAMPNAVEGKGVWGACGVNEARTGMTATETITSNPRVLGADPLVENGIGEEDIVSLVLPYIHNAREGVQRLGELLETYGTYEMNGIAFSDQNEIWWMETIGGHHWIARRVPDDAYVVMPNQLGIDKFDLEKALRDQEKYRCPCEEYADLEYMCSADLKEFISKNHLDLSMDGVLNPRDAFGSHDDSDHVYNTPRAWYMLRNLNPKTKIWDGVNAEFTPYSDDLPWCMIPEKKITVEDVKYVLSSHYQGTSYDPYASYGEKEQRGAFRSIGVNRTDFLSLIQMRLGMEKDCNILEWVAFASNAFNVLVPFYATIDTTPDYFSSTTREVTTDSFYWVSRMIGAMADASYKSSIFHIERYQERVMSKGHQLIGKYDALLEKESDAAKRMSLRHQANQEIADMVKKEASDTLNKVLYELSNQMKNAYSRSDA